MRALGPLLLLLVLALALASCGAESAEEPAGAPPADTAAPEQAAPGDEAGGEGCGRVEVPGHEAVDLRADGIDCATAREVAADAQGRGRAPYQAAGLACEPTDAADGDTTYACTGDAGRLTFLYGVR